MSNSLDPDQAPHFVSPNLGPNYLQKLSSDDTSRQRQCELSNPDQVRENQLPFMNYYIHIFTNFEESL